jgi:hypothetical protein
MYNKLFTKILDSSIWLESDATRLVWITFLASMNEDGFCELSAVGNVANKALVSIENAKEAIRVLESPDENSGDPEFGGRRIERVPGGWMVLNAAKYKQLATNDINREKTRLRVQAFRSRKQAQSNGHVTKDNEMVTPSETDTETDIRKNINKKEDLVLSPEESKKVKKKGPGREPKSFEEFLAYCESKKISEPDAQAIYATFVAGGWTLTGGKPVVNWKAHASSWQLHGYLPSQKANRK